MATATLFVSTLADPGEQSVAGGGFRHRCLELMRKAQALTATALFQTLLQVGATLGLSLTTTIATAYTHKATAAGEADIDALDAGFKAAFRLSAGIVFVALVIAVVMLRGLGIINRTAAPVQQPITPPAEEKEEEVGSHNDDDLAAGTESNNRDVEKGFE